MEYLFQSPNLAGRAFWLVKLRWIAILVLLGAVATTTGIMGMHLSSAKLYGLVGLLLGYNAALYGLLKVWTKRPGVQQSQQIGRVITFQISADLIILSTILHHAGGIENPFSFFFVFHMIMASILSSQRQSYAQATLAVVSFGTLVLLEALGVIAHYPLEGFYQGDLYRSPSYVAGFLLVFTVTLYLVVYMTSSIAQQLRDQQQALERANAQLEEKDKIKNQYVLRVTHDIKGHLAAIASTLQLVYDQTLGPLNEQQRDMAGRAYRRTGHCLEFIKTLLKVTRMKLSGRLDITCFSFRDLMGRAIGVVRQQAQAKEIQLSCRIDPTVGEVCGEIFMIEDALTNMLFNAVTYTPPGGSVEVEVRDQDHYVQINIIDTGIGIPDADKDRVFEEFYRARNARATERDGTGLGLSFVKQVVDRHGGAITLSDNIGGGSIFTIVLPKTSIR